VDTLFATDGVQLSARLSEAICLSCGWITLIS
jgi:hypothetical protein